MRNKIHNLIKKLNLVLTIVLLSFSTYLITSPILPKTGLIVNAKEWFKDEILNLKRNKILISTIGVNGEIYEGDEGVLNLGFWHRPNTSTPDRGGNTVIVAHKFLYTYGPNTFFNLYKIKTGDSIQISWKNIAYSYKVKTIRVVKSTDISVEENTQSPILTLYTCVSLWDQSERLVVIGEKI